MTRREKHRLDVRDKAIDFIVERALDPKMWEVLGIDLPDKWECYKDFPKVVRVIVEVLDSALFTHLDGGVKKSLALLSIKAFGQEPEVGVDFMRHGQELADSLIEEFVGLSKAVRRGVSSINKYKKKCIKGIGEKRSRRAQKKLFKKTTFLELGDLESCI